MYYFLYKKYLKKTSHSSVICEYRSIFSQRTSFNFCLWSSDFTRFARGSGCTNICARVSQGLRAWMRQPCPLVSGENASTAQDNDEIVLLVHCEIWIAGIRANEVAAGRSYSISSSLSLVTRTLVPLSIPVHRLRSQPLFILVFLAPLPSYPASSSHILPHAFPVSPTPRLRERTGEGTFPSRKRALYDVVYRERNGKTALGVYEIRCKLIRPNYRRDPRKRHDDERSLQVVKIGERPRHKLTRSSILLSHYGNFERMVVVHERVYRRADPATTVIPWRFYVNCNIYASSRTRFAAPRTDNR